MTGRRKQKKKKKKGMHPAVAVVALLGSVGYLSMSISDLYSDDVPTGAARVTNVGVQPAEEPPPEASQSPETDVEHQLGDLLEAFGSYDAEEPVRWAFFDLDYSKEVGAAPMGEVVEIRRPIWLGDDPPALRLSMVMVREGSRQAILCGDLVGVGETCGSVTVVSIEPGVVVLRWQKMDLTYEIGREIPVEFLNEWTRRQLDRRESLEGEAEEGDQ